MTFATAIVLGFIAGAIINASGRAINLWWVKSVMGPVHNHEEGELSPNGEPCFCWERQGLRRPVHHG